MKDSKPEPMMDVIAHAQRDRAIAILAELEAEPCRLNKLELIERLLPPSSAAAGSEREAFWQWCQDRCYHLPKEFITEPNRVIMSDATERAWEAWQARAAAPPNDTPSISDLRSMHNLAWQLSDELRDHLLRAEAAAPAPPSRLEKMTEQRDKFGQAALTNRYEIERLTQVLQEIAALPLGDHRAKKLAAKAVADSGASAREEK